MRFHIEPLHPIPVDFFGDGVTFSRQDLISYGHTLSNRPISINHAPCVNRYPKFGTSSLTMTLPYPENRTLEIRYNSTIDGLEGEIEVSDVRAISMITNYEIRHLSVEHVRNFHAIEFNGLALLTYEFPPRDPEAKIVYPYPPPARAFILRR